LIVNKNQDIDTKYYKVTDATGTRPWANFKGITIGNGLVDPAHQYPAYYTFSLHHNIMSEQKANLLRRPANFCANLLLEKQYTSTTQAYCEEIVDGI